MIDLTPQNGFVIIFSENYDSNCYLLTTNSFGWPQIIIYIKGRYNASVLSDISKYDTLPTLLEYLTLKGFNER